jgi:putative hemolysin
MNVDEQGGFNGQGNGRDRRAARMELRRGNADGEHELQRETASSGESPQTAGRTAMAWSNSGELYCESEGGARRESELEQGEGEGSAGIL